jgi:hypothetical protein
MTAANSQRLRANGKARRRSTRKTSTQEIATHAPDMARSRRACHLSEFQTSGLNSRAKKFHIAASSHAGRSTAGTNWGLRLNSCHTDADPTGT